MNKRSVEKMVASPVHRTALPLIIATIPLPYVALAFNQLCVICIICLVELAAQPVSRPAARILPEPRMSSSA